MLKAETTDRVRLLTLDRPDVLNAFNDALFGALREALTDAADDDGVAVVVVTGEGRAFSAGADLTEMGDRTGDGGSRDASHFPPLIELLAEFPKPLLIAVNGIGVGIGATILGFADLAFMAADARLRCPFTALGVAPEAASSSTFPALIGRQNAAWVLLSSEWIDAEEALEMGLVWKVCEPEELLDVALDHARRLARMPIASLVESKRLIGAGTRDAIAAARKAEDEAFGRLLAGPAAQEASAAFIEKREPDFTGLPSTAS